MFDVLIVIQGITSVSMTSMNSGSVNYHDPTFQLSNKETVNNPYAVIEDDEDDMKNPLYQEPSRILDRANARPNRQYNGSYPSNIHGHVQPASIVETSEAVINTNYGVPPAIFGNYTNEPPSPTYQSPDELAGVCEKYYWWALKFTFLNLYDCSYVPLYVLTAMYVANVPKTSIWMTN